MTVPSAERDPRDEPHAADLLGLPQRAAPTGRDQLEVIASAYLDALRAGGRPDPESWIARHPALADELREFLPLVSAMEDWKAEQELRSLRAPLPEQFEIEQLGEYRILREIARGGMGVIFEAEQSALDRRVAIKLLPWRIPRHSSWAERFVREAHVAARLQHAHIVPIYSFGEQDERYYYVMQLVQGVGLDRLIDRWRTSAGVVCLDELTREFHPDLRRPAHARSGRFLRHDNWPQLVKIAAQIASGLRFAHQQGTLHRDIKPANLLIDVAGTVRIADFGLAVRSEQEFSELAGTIRYMAPEQFEGQASVRSDIYSLGVTVYELITLQPAFTGSTQSQLVDAIQNSRFARPRSLRPDIPPPLEKILLRAMAPDPAERYDSIDALQIDLRGSLRGAGRRRSGLWNAWGRLFPGG